MWQANHANINAELARQHPQVWDRITALRSQGLKTTDPEMAAEFAVAARLVRFYNPDNAQLLPSEPGARNLELYPRVHRPLTMDRPRTTSPPVTRQKHSSPRRVASAPPSTKTT